MQGAGAAFVMTQIAYDVDALAAWADVVRPRGVFERASVLVGVAPLRSAKQARYMNERLPGVHVPDGLVKALDDAGAYLRFSGTYTAKDEAEEDAIMAETLTRLKGMNLRF